jgi:L-lysine exporter family protein LysE/ArgO
MQAFQPLLAGFALGFSLILAIGAQNAFVLKNGLRRSHVFWICLTCAVSDAILIACGVAGFGYVIEQVPWLIPVIRYAGAAFLGVYGARSMYSAFRGGSVMQAQGAEVGLGSAILTCLALTWLNPHVYLDTVILLGSVAAQSDAPSLFGAGAVCASFVFFFSLGYGARFLAPLFSRPMSWRILDAGIAVVMWGLAIGLLLDH